MWRIAKGLFLGDWRDARDREVLLGAGITHVLNCAEELTCCFRREFRYFHVKLADPDRSFQDYIEEICRFIHRGRKAGAVLVHCAHGRNRSASALLAYMCWRGKTLDEGLEIIRKRVGESVTQFRQPEPSFLEQIESHFEE